MTEASDLYQQILAVLARSKVGLAWAAVSSHLPRLDVYLAGGSVRDILLGRAADLKDFDFFLGGEGVKEAIAALAQRGVVRSGPFGSPRWFLDEEKTVYCDVIPIESFFNGLWRCEDIVDVLNQFDFTANAVAVHLGTGCLHDPQNGRRDVARRLIRAVRFDYPEEPIGPAYQLTRPAIVWFRLLHYAACLGFTIEPVTLEWVIRQRAFLKQMNDFTATFFPLHPEALAPIRNLVPTIALDS